MAKKINVKLILELRSAGMGRNAIAASRHISKNSVGDVFHIADRMGISYENIAQMDEDTVYRKFYPDKFALESLYDKPDYEYVHQELKRTGVTLKLLWQEYQDKCRASGNIPMGYTKYCQGYSEYTIVNKLTNHLEHKPGVAVEVDWSGPTMTYVDTSTGGDRNRIPVCRDTALQPVLLRGTLPGHEDGQLYPRPHPHVWVLRRGCHASCLR